MSEAVPAPSAQLRCRALMRGVLCPREWLRPPGWRDDSSLGRYVARALLAAATVAIVFRWCGVRMPQTKDISPYLGLLGFMPASVPAIVFLGWTVFAMPQRAPLGSWRPMLPSPPAPAGAGLFVAPGRRLAAITRACVARFAALSPYLVVDLGAFALSVVLLGSAIPGGPSAVLERGQLVVVIGFAAAWTLAVAASGPARPGARGGGRPGRFLRYALGKLGRAVVSLFLLNLMAGFTWEMGWKKGMTAFTWLALAVAGVYLAVQYLSAGRVVRERPARR